MFRKGGSRGWVTTETISWHIGKKNSGHVVTIPAGREFESSVPRCLHWLMDPDDPRFLWAALVHDHFLERGYRAFFAAGEWLDGARKGGAPDKFASMAAVAIAVRGLVKAKTHRKQGQNE